MKKLIFFTSLLFCGNALALSSAIPLQHSPNAAITIAVTNSSAQAIAANINRTGLLCVNVGSANASLSFNGAAQVNYGITLLPGIYWWTDDYMFSTAAMNVISPTSTTLSCQEWQ